MRRLNRPPPPPWAWAAGGALAGMLCAVLVFAPARWLAAAVAQVSGAHLILLNPQGSVWNGSAQLVLSGGAGSNEAMALSGRLAWQVLPAWGAWQLRLDAPCCTPNALHVAASARWDGLHLSLKDSRSQWPAELLTGLGTPWNTVQAQGVLDLSTQGLALSLSQDHLALTGHAQLEALDVSSRLSTLKPMGSYRLSLNGGVKDGEPIGMKLTTLQGSLHLNGQGHWKNSRWHFEGAASAAPDRLDALSNLLNIIGRRDGARSLITIG